ncbi:uncharacterized protein LOC130442101 [Diorhabda sublineata]|uniref:uncharacterized protein LOC130442101 n=1 Tax=Diorhabda sublineata TaxID=1163346 RepID=UPI0024E06788|nr:uncharacterized protein LOC130442101 [Diorhabda sublineata]
MSACVSLPSDILESLICSNCSNYLSVFPIYTKIDNSGALCGRCKVAEVDKYLKDEAYECIAQFLTFPCMYTKNGCTENHIPTKLEQHERRCSWQKLGCPSKNYSKCQWIGHRSDLEKHFASQHPNLVLKDRQFQLSFINSLEETYLLSYMEELFILKKEIDAMKANCYCSVQHLQSSEESNSFGYSLKIESSDKNYFFNCPEKSTCSDEKLNCTQITADIIKEKLFGSDSVIVNVNIYIYYKSYSLTDFFLYTTVIQKENSLEFKVNWDLLAEMECPICYNYMLPPIFQCIHGHSLCGACKENINGICKKVVKDTRNFTLEKTANRLLYPCKFHKSGCTYSCLATEIKEHQSSCRFGPQECPLSDSTDCSWSGFHSEVFAHVENNHNDDILKGDKIEIPFERDRTSSVVYLIERKKKIFKLCYAFDGSKFYWCVQLVGFSEVAKDYRFEVDLIDLSGSKLRFYHLGLVVPLTKLADCYKCPGKFVVATLEQVENFVTNSICFRVNIVEK